MAHTPQLSSKLMLFALTVSLLAGCGSGVTAFTSTSSPGAALSVLPSSTSVTQGSNITFSTNNGDSTTCQWASSDVSILSPVAGGEFLGNTAGNSTVSATCGSSTATALVVVKAVTVSPPIKITSGGTYSGNWSSTDPTVPAVSVVTDQPVIIQNSTISSRGDIIWISGTKGANVTVNNVTGTALDPLVSGVERGRFVVGSMVDTLVVTHNTMHGASLGVLVGGNAMTSIKIIGNTADGMEDRASDGKGGFLTTRPSLGHFIAIARTTIKNGAEVAWNQMIDSIGNTSLEDTISLYDAAGGSSAAPIYVHDNYLEGAASAATTTYTGVGILTDGPGNDGGPVPAFINVTNNQIVHTAGGGIGVAAGHDVTMSGNRIVSCGKDASGNWFAMPYATATSMFNYYNSAFYNNTITTTAGGLLRPSSTNTAQIGDSVPLTAALIASNNSISGNLFTDPCLLPNGSVNPLAEATETARWVLKLLQSGQKIGDQH